MYWYKFRRTLRSRVACPAISLMRDCLGMISFIFQYSSSRPLPRREINQTAPDVPLLPSSSFLLRDGLTNMDPAWHRPPHVPRLDILPRHADSTSTIAENLIKIRRRHFPRMTCQRREFFGDFYLLGSVKVLFKELPSEHSYATTA